MALQFSVFRDAINVNGKTKQKHTKLAKHSFSARIVVESAVSTQIPKRPRCYWGEKPERSGRKSNLPVELLLHADCLDVKEFILLKDESIEDT